VIPIKPISKSFRITVQEGKTVTCAMTQKQLPITAAYTCMGYRAQGQTLPAVIIDIRTPPTGGRSLFNLYVALSRSTGPSEEIQYDFFKVLKTGSSRSHR
ncbi:hypothetical protein PAXRUDRAFT_145609, partial [Paxillus rubicundulus Ve08.2h10]